MQSGKIAVASDAAIIIARVADVRDRNEHYFSGEKHLSIRCGQGKHRLRPFQNRSVSYHSQNRKVKIVKDLFPVRKNLNDGTARLVA